MVEMAKVTKDGTTKEIMKKDLPFYISNGWKEIKNYVPKPQIYEKV